MAAQLGISRTAVSLALRNHPAISEETRRRVRAHADLVGYRSNVLVNALMTHVRTRRVVPNGEVIAYLTVGPTAKDALNTPTNAAYYAGAREQAEKLGFRLEVFWLGPEGAHARQQARVLRNRAVRGAILSPLPVETGPLDLDWNDQPVVALGYSFRHHNLHRATNNHFTGMYTCYERLRSFGYKRIGLALAEENDQRVRHHWLAGYLTARQVLGGGCARILLFGSTKPKAQFLRWFSTNRPDAVIGILPDPTVAWLGEEGVRIPGDIGYASVDLAPANPLKLAGIRQSSERIAATAVETLATQIYTNRRGLPQTPVLLLIDGEWVEGSTVKRRL
jgi:LacI family transcriptional regulator